MWKTQSMQSTDRHFTSSCLLLYRYIKEPVRQEEIGRNPDRVLGITAIEGELDGEHQGNQAGQICPDL